MMYAMLRFFGCCACDLLDEDFAWVVEDFVGVDDACDETMPAAKKMRSTQMNCATQTDVSWTYHFPFVFCGSSPVDDREL